MNIQEVIKDCLREPYYLSNFEISISETGRNPSMRDNHKLPDIQSAPNSIATPQSTIVHNESTDLVIKNKKLYRLMQKVWLAYLKFLYRQIFKGNCVHSLHLGKFFPKRPPLIATKSTHVEEQTKITSNNNNRGFCYIPSVELLEKGKFIFYENQCNLNPMSGKVIILYIYIYIV